MHAVQINNSLTGQGNSESIMLKLSRQYLHLMASHFVASSENESSQIAPNAGHGLLAHACRARVIRIARVSARVVKSIANSRQTFGSERSGGDCASTTFFGSEASASEIIGSAADTNSFESAKKPR